ncbi:MAG: YHYH protein [Chitinophagaceae bacterium]
MKMKLMFPTALFFALIFCACSKSDSSTSTTPANTTLPDVFKKFNSTVTISTDGTYITIKSNGLPDHKSPYFATTDSRYEAYNGTNAHFSLNPNRISEQSLTFKIPLNPAEASSKQATPLGPIGVSLNGVPLFNQYAGPSQPLTSEINSFDQYNGHPQQTGQYHYHVEPLYITAAKGKSSLIGFLLDGYPVYGPVENGTTLVSSNLDAYHGHTSATADYPNGIYHYHITADAPYINGNGFWGTPGTVTQ